MRPARAVGFLFSLALCVACALGAFASEGSRRADNVPPEGFTALFNGTDLDGWKGLVGNPLTRATMSRDELATAQTAADQRMRAHWKVIDGALEFDGGGDSLCTVNDYRNFELLVDWRIKPNGDSGIYLRGSPQVQIWERPEGSGGIYNNQKNPSRPLISADREIGEWNSFRIIMVDERVTVYLNEVLVVDDVVMENYWDRGQPIFPTGQIELQNHGNTLWFKNVFIRELPEAKPPVSPVLQRGDRVAITGDSITEQKIYSRFMEMYLLACQPQLDLRVMQFGWSGERAPGFAARMENDLLPFEPDVVTTCYGMNDGLYRPYEASIGATYENAMNDIITRLGERGVEVVVGSPGAVDTFYFRPQNLPAAVYNRNLGRLRDIARDLAREHGFPFANVLDPMILAMLRAKPERGDEYHVGGPDGVHPRENGHLVMAYAYLKALDVDGHIGTITVDLRGKATATDGHTIRSSNGGRVTIESSRYPFCFFGDGAAPTSTSGMLPYLPFNQRLNRLMLVVDNLNASYADVSWGTETKRFHKDQLHAGVNLAAEFIDNPFRDDFARVEALVAEKQAFETHMIKGIITKHRGGPDDEATRAGQAAERDELFAQSDALHEKVRAAITPVVHEIVITPVIDE